MSQFLFTSESVSEGHPDKICDQISDAVLDAALKEDSGSRVACESMVSTGLVVVSGEMTTRSYIDIREIVRGTLKEIGYVGGGLGFDYESCGIISSINKQSPDIAMGVNTGGAGDQGMMFGYASNETEEGMPMPIMLAHKLMERLTDLRKSGELYFLRPDAKSQVTVKYEDDRPVGVDTVVVSAQHTEEVSNKEIKESIIERVIYEVIPKDLRNGMTIHINPTGRFVIGGPQGDCGLTGRKIIVDTYGGFGRHGGGAFSGKDPSKVDRSGAYMSRHIAKNLVFAKLCDRCEVQLAYAIGIAEPVSIHVNTYGGFKGDKKELIGMIRENFDLTPEGIIRSLDLRKPIYKKTAVYGHFGRSGFSWEDTSLSKKLVSKLGQRV